MNRSILDYFDVTLEVFSNAILGNPSLRGMVLGYLAEAKLKEILLGHGKGSAFRKDDDHDRKKKGDLVVTYEGFEFKIEVKSLQTNTVKMQLPTGGLLTKIIKQKGPGMPNPDYGPAWEKWRYDAVYWGQLQCDASDRRPVNFPDGSKVETTCLQFGDFDILAAGLFSFREKWDFGYALNCDLPSSTFSAYSPQQREQLIKSMIPITWPLQTPFVSDIYELLDRLVVKRKAAAAGRPIVKETKIVVEPPVVSVEDVEKKQVKIVEKKRKKKS